MRACHKKIVIANFSNAAVGTPTMDRAILANDVLVADHDLRFPFRRKGKILWRRANNRKRTDLDIGADSRARIDKSGGMNLSAAHGLIETQTCSLCGHRSFTPVNPRHRTKCPLAAQATCLCSRSCTMVLFTARPLL